jgi:hypothetical protein
MSKKDIAFMETPPAYLSFWIAEYEVVKNNNDAFIPYTLEQIAEEFHITVEQIEKYKKLPSFRAEVRANIENIKNSSYHIRHKAQVQFEIYLDQIVPKLIKDEETPVSEKIKLLAFLAKTARVNDDPAEKAKAEAEIQSKQPQQQSAPTLNLYLTTGETKQSIPIDIQAERIVDERTEDK